MTNPTQPPAPYQYPSTPMWCSRCEIHWAATHQPLCPSCLDDRAREIRGES